MSNLDFHGIEEVKKVMEAMIGGLGLSRRVNCAMKTMCQVFGGFQ
jgi:hypothetical protein